MLARDKDLPPRAISERRTFRWVVAVVAALVGLMIMLWPRSEIRYYGWEFGGPIPAGAGSITIELDTLSGVISSSLDLGDEEFPPGTAFSMSGENGDGWLHVEAIDPYGVVVVRRDIAPRAEFEIPQESSPDAVSPQTEDQIDARVRTDASGTYVVRLSSPTGRDLPFFSLDGGSETVVAVPIKEYPAAWIGVLWLGAALAVAVSGLNRLSGSLLLGSALIIPIVLVVSDVHRWYWVVPTGVLVVAAVGAAGLGAALVVPPRESWRLRSAGVLVVVLCIVLTLGAVGSSAAYEPMNPPYAGDYLVKALHLFLMGASVVLAAIAGALIGHEAVGEESASDPPGDEDSDVDRFTARVGLSQ